MCVKIWFYLAHLRYDTAEIQFESQHTGSNLFLHLIDQRVANLEDIGSFQVVQPIIFKTFN